MKLLDGILLAQSYKIKLMAMISERNLKPRLDVILVGNSEASKLYVKKKQEACNEVGIESRIHKFDETEELKVNQLIACLSDDYKVNGILVQLPLPVLWNANRIFDLLEPMKDVDVFSPVNVGLLVQNRPRFLPPTPLAVQKLIIDYGFTFKGKHVVLINRSNIVGKPLSSMLIQDNIFANATVTVCHDNTPAAILKQICLSADIIVVAVGIPNFLTVDMVQEHQVIIDVGITRQGKKVVGDVHPEVYNKVTAASKVPKGVGPCTVMMLLHNTVEATILQAS